MQHMRLGGALPGQLLALLAGGATTSKSSRLCSLDQTEDQWLALR
jgi:hypothetical protein